LTLDRSALVKALPSIPAPGGSVRPRANTTSVLGQAADAVAMCEDPAGAAAGATTMTAARKPAAQKPRIECAGEPIDCSFMFRS
jgi:hypothetical protein